MLLKKMPLADTRSFSPFFIDYIQQKETLKKFYNRFPSTDQFAAQIKEKSESFPAHNREVLVNTLTRQYKDFKISDHVAKNISSLQSNNTFTITTGHQLNILTGPLYFIYKIVTVINTCKELKTMYPEYNFVPLYWMASEDHDYDEIKYFNLYGKKYTWETNQQGAVGRFSTDGLSHLINGLPGDTELFRTAYTKNKKLSAAVRYYVNELFSDEGVLVIDGDDASLKILLKDVIKDDLTKHSAKSHVDKTDQELNTLGYKTQVYCRDINFFYLEDGLRSRIEKQGDLYTVVDSDISFTSQQMEALIETNPEKFSPNVILRPLYQEIILPNLAYVGGPAEVIYWLQLKEVFSFFKAPFPILMPRNFAMVVEQPLVRKFEKTKLELKDLFEEKTFVYNQWVLKNTQHDLTVGGERSTVKEIFASLKQKANTIDQTLIAFVNAEEKRALTSLQKIEHRLIRAEKRLHSDKLRQIELLKDQLFPKGGLQERTDNFLNFYQQDNQFIKKLLSNFDPFDFRFNVLMLEA